MSEPCKTCGTCPTCGRGPQTFGPVWVVPYWVPTYIPPSYPSPYWQQPIISSGTSVTGPFNSINVVPDTNMRMVQ